jgi:hypothetical protein
MRAVVALPQPRVRAEERPRDGAADLIVVHAALQPLLQQLSQVVRAELADIVGPVAIQDREQV